MQRCWEVVLLSYVLFGLADWRDIIVIAVGSMTMLVLLAILFFTVVLGLALRGLIGTARRVLSEEVSPLIGSAKETVHTVRGTATFVGEKAAGPIIRVYSIVAGARRAAAVITGITGHRDGRG